jgi:hypothetical protein
VLFGLIAEFFRIGNGIGKLLPRRTEIAQAFLDSVFNVFDGLGDSFDVATIGRHNALIVSPWTICAGFGCRFEHAQPLPADLSARSCFFPLVC